MVEAHHRNRHHLKIILQQKSDSSPSNNNILGKTLKGIANCPRGHVRKRWCRSEVLSLHCLLLCFLHNWLPCDLPHGSRCKSFIYVHLHEFFQVFKQFFTPKIQELNFNPPFFLVTRRWCGKFGLRLAKLLINK